MSECRYWYLDPYPVPSHAHVRDQYIQHSRYDWTIQALPPKGWRWRLHNSGATFAVRHVAAIASGDTLLTTSMLDVVQLRGLLGHDVTVIQYMHENQLTYACRTEPVLADVLRQTQSLLAADAVVFNSYHHRDALAAALTKTQASWPDDHGLAAAPQIAQAASVVYPAIPDPGPPAMREGAPLLLWNHRFCDEKRGDRLLQILNALAERGCRLRLAVVGSPNERPPKVFDTIRKNHAHDLVAFGHQPRERYLELLSTAHCVLSTADEENFGIAVAEAAMAGAIPLIPRRRVYPELYGSVPAARVYGHISEAVEQLHTLLTTPESELRPQRMQLYAHLQPLLAPDRIAGQFDQIIASAQTDRATQRPSQRPS